jgi:hypothetical protein
VAVSTNRFTLIQLGEQDVLREFARLACAERVEFFTTDMIGLDLEVAIVEMAVNAGPAFFPRVDELQRLARRPTVGVSCWLHVPSSILFPQIFLCWLGSDVLRSPELSR